MAYAAENGGKERWGFAVEPGMVAYSWTMLLLDRGTPITRFDEALEEASEMGIFKLPPEKNAIHVVGDYLSKVYQHILHCISKEITEQMLQITPLEFWFTVPAMGLTRRNTQLCRLHVSQVSVADQKGHKTGST
jgi:hypothetical protein